MQFYDISCNSNSSVVFTSRKQKGIKEWNKTYLKCITTILIMCEFYSGHTTAGTLNWSPANCYNPFGDDKTKN